MRPVTLTMSAFGPYAGKVVIDFNRLGENGIYLITGDTGAGKTTIFDGITYALFGSASGENRESSMLRSKYAKDNTETYAELVFLYRGKEYRVKRNPEYIRKKSRGEGTTKQTADAELVMPDGRVITQKKKVTEQIEAVLGINREQFSRIAMIAQGDFLKLLLADTSERQKIFRKIFNTEIFLKFQEKIKTKLGEINRERDKVNTGIKQYINGIESDGDENRDSFIKEAVEGNIPAGEIQEFIEKLIEKDREKLDENKDALLKKEELIKLAEDKLKKKEERNQKAAELEKTEKQIELKGRTLSEIQKQLKEREDTEERTEKINGEIILLEKEFENYEILDSTVEKIKETEKILADMNRKKEVREKELRILNEDTDKMKEQLDSLTDAGETLITLDRRKEKLETDKEQLEAYESDLKVFRKTEEQYIKARDIYAEAGREAEVLRKEGENKRRIYNDEQAGILAADLEEGIPCPVCGSLSHPCKASLREDAPSLEEVEAAERKGEEALRKANRKSVDAGKLKGEKDALFRELEKKKEKLPELNKSIGESLADIHGELKNIKERIKDEEEKVKVKKTLETRIPENEEKIKETDNLCRSLHEKCIMTEGERKSFSDKADELRKNLTFESGHMLNEHIRTLKKERDSLKAEKEKLDRDFKECEGDIKTLTGRKETIGQELLKMEDIDTEDVAAELKELRREKEELERCGRSVYHRVEVNRKAGENLEKKAGQLKELDEKWKWISSLSNTANGNISGREKIMLETYVQMTYFDRIIRRANVHFMKMSGGQYDLVRRKTSDNHRSQTGLELDVIDHYNGSVRSVKSLSGGESFIASLSLALGMSEEIQASAGGIKLDTMFVDEGFGSLDEETLQQAMKALYSLAEGNRTIGIISHVAELRREIDSQILVTKEKTGSSVKIVV